MHHQPVKTPEYEDIFFSSEDGVRIHARDYQPVAQSPQKHSLPILCLHGLTRNCRDFEPMIAALRAESGDQCGTRYVVPDQRGRGLSEFSSPDTYSPVTYAQDMWALMNFLEIEEFLLIGTSMGGIISMLMSSDMEEAHRIKGVCLNDIGPTLDASGLEKILEYLGKGMQADNWEEAVENTKISQLKNFPDFSEEDWFDFVKRTYREDDAGSLCLDYDPAISELIKLTINTQDASDLWPLFDNTYRVPTLTVRGEHSDLLSRKVVVQMEEKHPLIQSVEIANRGHAPILDEPAALSSIRSWIKSCNSC